MCRNMVLVIMFFATSKQVNYEFENETTVVTETDCQQLRKQFY